jgi:electron transport complex protein RnfG
VETLVGVAGGARVVAVRVVSASRETPGLGLLVKEQSFLGQFSGQPAGVRFIVVTRAPGAPGEVQAVTGATISSRAVVRAVNVALELEAALAGTRTLTGAGTGAGAGAGAGGGGG